MTPEKALDQNRLVHLRFRPLWLYLDQVRDFCGFFARASFDSDQLGERVGIIVHELVENAVRYGDDQELEVTLERRADEILVCVANTTTDERAGKLRALVAEMARQSPGEAYAAAMRLAATLPKTESGLGLPRIRYEGRVDLEVETTPGRVSVTARGTA
ncbi:MAG TPA: hypothetical protein VHE30_11960 [Polyangiaceae bacterium]|nr:hypothetical protein [Polyangiaceae bacterium]